MREVVRTLQWLENIGEKPEHTAACSFGRLLEGWSSWRSEGSPGISSSFVAAMFSKIYSRPLCSVFASSSEPGFAGPCEALPVACEDETRWCNGDNGKNDGPMVVQGAAPRLFMHGSPQSPLAVYLWHASHSSLCTVAFACRLRIKVTVVEIGCTNQKADALCPQADMLQQPDVLLCSRG